jgi:hypothetical protein
MSKQRRDELKRKMTEVANPYFVKDLADANIRPAINILTQAVLELDATSEFLSWVNIGVGVVVAIVGGLTLWFTIRAH